MRATTRDHSFRDEASEMGKKVLMFEGGKSMHLDRIVTRAGITGAMRVLHHLGAKNFQEQIDKLSTVDEQIIVGASSWVRAKYSGMFRSDKPNGSHVDKGDRIGTITDPFGDFEKVVKAPWSGFIICVNHNPIVNQGDALMHLTKDVESITRNPPTLG